jgi:7-cyano-7-deazaguanine reductase
MVAATEHDLPLGKPLAYVTTYTPSLLRSIPRAESRASLSVPEPLPFHGEDVWTCYEFSWLNIRGRPEAGVLQLQVPCTSAQMVESKSLKLYLNSFVQTAFKSRTELLRTLDSDLVLAFRAPVMISLSNADQAPQLAHLPGKCLDHLDVTVDCYDPDASLLALDDAQRDTHVRETVYTHLLRSLCPITGQPDWASLMIEYAGTPIRHEALLRYLVSFRTHAAFHESTIERIFMDILRRCGPERLSVYGRYLRRGGIDINPFRSTHDTVAPALRLARQ